MPVRTHHVAFGRPATEALARVVAVAQADDPLAPVTVVVPSNVVGITARRLLGSGEVVVEGSQRSGVANLTFSTPHQLAARLGGPGAAADRVPLSNPVLAAAARQALRERPGALGPVASHPATEQAVVRIYGELSHLTEGARARLRSAGRPASADLLDLIDAVRRHLGDHFDEDDVAAAAAAAVRAGGGSALGTVVLHLLDALTPAHERLFEAVAEAGEVVVVVGRTGVEAADAALRPPVLAARSEVAISPSRVTAVVSTSDPDEEVRAVVRLLAARLEAGDPLHRVAVLYPTEEPYARILHEQLDAAGIAWNGPSTTRLADAVAGRTLRRFLDLAGADFGRDAVIDLVSGAPVRDRDGRIAPATRWDRLSRQAGVIGGGDWTGKLTRRQAGLELDLELADSEDRPGRRASIERDLADLRALDGFLAWLVDAATPPERAGWRERARWAQEAIADLLGPESRRVRWPDVERDRAELVEGALDRVSVLDPIEGEPSAEVFARAVADELDRPVGREGRVGVGALLAPLAAAPGLDADMVVVVGLAEGSCPAPRHEDSLLPDHDRRLTAGELTPRADRIVVEQAQLLAALAAGRHERILVHPRGDHRSGRTRLPSRWLLGALGPLVGRTVHGSEYDGLHHPALLRIESFVDGLTGTQAPASVHDLDLRTLVSAGEGPQPLDDDRVLRSGFEATTARRGPEFTRFDGNLAGVPLVGPLDSGLLSATRVETWAGCPFRYYLGYVLGLGAIERPERITEINPLDRGSLVHEVLERFGRDVLARPPPARPGPGEPWPDGDRRRLIEIAGEVCDDYEARGLTGRPLLWRLRRTALLRDFVRFLDADDTLRAEFASSLESVEVPFGMAGVEPVGVQIGDGRTARFRGAIDRVDRTAEGEAVVLDYKTGKAGRDSTYRELGDDPVVRGTRVQLALYAEAARQQHDADRPTTNYWFATSDGRFERVGFPYTPERSARLREVVSRVVGNIESGVFPARSGEHDPFWGRHDNCGWCDFDRLCPRDRHEQWLAKVSAPELADYVALAEPEAALAADDVGTTP